VWLNQDELSIVVTWRPFLYYKKSTPVAVIVVLLAIGYQFWNSTYVLKNGAGAGSPGVIAAVLVGSGTTHCMSTKI